MRRGINDYWMKFNSSIFGWNYARTYWPSGEYVWNYYVTAQIGPKIGSRGLIKAFPHGEKRFKNTS